VIAVALVHPDTPNAAAYRHGRQIGYTSRGWLRCRTADIVGLWQPDYTMLTHASIGRSLPDDIGMEPAHYALVVDARTSDKSRDRVTLLRLGPYTQTRHTQEAHNRLTAALEGRETVVVPGARVTVRYAPFDPRRVFTDPYGADIEELLDTAVESLHP
jgi:hypothetical protein